MKIRLVVFSILLLANNFVWVPPVRADGSILEDRNGDGEIEVIAFGDSLTYGVGDGIEPGLYISSIDEVGDPSGYPLRLSSLLGVSVLNAGVPGEQVVRTLGGPKESGTERFPSVVLGSSADVVLIKEGANDTQQETPTSQVMSGLQKMINVARADNRNVVLATLALPTVQHSMFAPLSSEYSEGIRNLAAINSLPLVDVEKGFFEGCPDYSTCVYYNLPEGLHPNTVGYDAMAQMFATALQ